MQHQEISNEAFTSFTRLWDTLAERGDVYTDPTYGRYYVNSKGSRVYYVDNIQTLLLGSSFENPKAVTAANKYLTGQYDKNLR